MSEPTTVLELFSDESKWNKRATALDERGKQTLISGPDAKSWCLLGAIEKVYGLRYNAIRGRLLEVLPLKYCNDLIDFNDSPLTTFQDVIDLVTKAGI